MRIIAKNKMLYNVTFSILVLIFFLDSNCFYMIKLPKSIAILNSFNNKYLIILLILVSIIFLAKTNQLYFRKKMFWWKYTMILLCVLLIISVYSIYMYNQNFIDVFTVWHHWLVVFLTIPLLYILIKDNDIKKIMKIINIMAITMCILLIIQSVIYNNTGKLFLNGILSDSIQVRKGNIRIGVSNIVYLSIIYNISRIFNDNKSKYDKKINYYMYLAIELYTLVCVQMTRVVLIIIFGVALFIVLANRKNKIKKYIIVILGIVVLIMFVDVGAFINSFSIEAGNGMQLSTTTRIDAIEYYFNVILENPLFGNGFIRESRQDLRSIVHGIYGVYYYTDVGLIGLVAEQGILGLFTYIYIILFMVDTWFKGKRCKNIIDEVDNGIIIGIIMYWILSSFTLIVTDASRILMIPLTISIFEFYRLKYKINNKK